jgi:hypothetical protein
MIAGVMSLLAVAAIAAAFVACGKQKVAEDRYQQALGLTLRLVTTAATFRSLLDGSPFSAAQVEAKGASDDFQEFRRTAKDPDDIWFRLSEVLVAFEKQTPAEMRHFQSRLDESRMRVQWLRHAEMILNDLERRHPGRPKYAPLRAELRREIARLESAPAQDTDRQGVS